jgi:hypothetical protein
MAGGSPRKTSSGNVTAEPLDATVLKKPQRNPAPTIMINWIMNLILVDLRLTG